MKAIDKSVVKRIATQNGLESLNIDADIMKLVKSVIAYHDAPLENIKIDDLYLLADNYSVVLITNVEDDGEYPIDGMFIRVKPESDCSPGDDTCWSNRGQYQMGESHKLDLHRKIIDLKFVLE